MRQNDSDTIVAEATPRGRGGVGIVRVSGPHTSKIAETILGKIPEIRKSETLPFLDPKGFVLDYGVALFFKGPHSFTGEDILELQGHGGPVVMDSLVKAAIAAGARSAEPGEFSLRAFLNNKIDLLQAEAIADLIHANTEQAARSAVRSLQGAFSELIEALVQDLIQLRMYIEAALDFPDEEIDFLQAEQIPEKLNRLLTSIEHVIAKAKQGALRSEGIVVAIAGRPNAGKSSLLNALSGYDTAIVTDIPGTTRDVLRESITIDGLLVQFVDTAGLRESNDAVEQEGVRRALKEVSMADHVVWVVDGSETEETDPAILFSEVPEWTNVLSKTVGMTVLVNKIDKTGKQPAKTTQETHTIVSLSVKTGAGMDLFREHLKQVVGFTDTESDAFIARRRHVEALSQAKMHLMLGLQQLKEYKAIELLAEELRQAQLALDHITGKFTSDDLLGKIFSEFCIGK